MDIFTIDGNNIEQVKEGLFRQAMVTIENSKNVAVLRSMRSRQHTRKVVFVHRTEETTSTQERLLSFSPISRSRQEPDKQAKGSWKKQKTIQHPT